MVGVFVSYAHATLSKVVEDSGSGWGLTFFTATAISVVGERHAVEGGIAEVMRAIFGRRRW